MRLPGQDKNQEALALFSQEWHQRHPGVAPPSPFSSTPQQWSDPLSRESAQLFRECQQAVLTPPSTSPTTPVWTPLAGGSILCPNGHVLSLTARYCPGCGLKVPATAVADAQNQLAVLDARAWQAWQQMPKPMP